MKKRLQENTKQELTIFFGTLGSAIVMLLILMFAAPVPAVAAEVEAEEISVDWYLGYAEGLGLAEDFCERAGINPEEVRFFQLDDLTYEYLTTRQDIVVVEVILGICYEDGNGEILNTATEYDYISYDEDILPGDIVLTFNLYDPDGQGEDDIVRRDDYVIDTNQLIEE